MTMPTDADVVALLGIVSVAHKSPRDARDPEWRRRLAERHLADNVHGAVSPAAREFVGRWVSGDVGLGRLNEAMDHGRSREDTPAGLG